MTYLTLFIMFFKIGLFTFGGGYAMIPLIMSETVKAGFLTDSELIDFIAVSESTPGPFAVNIATYVGMKTAGFLGAVCSTLGVVFPSFVIILIVVSFYDSFKKQKVVEGVMTGLKACVVGLIFASAFSIACTIFIPSGIALATFDIKFFTLLGIFALMLFLTTKKLGPILIIIISAVIGITAGYIFQF